MAFPITGVAIVNRLGENAEEVAKRLRKGAGDPSIAVTGAGALFEHAHSELAPEVARARNRWGARRLAVVLGCAHDPDPLLTLAVALTGARGPAYATTTGPLASAHAIVSAHGLLVAGFADTVAVGTVSPEGAPAEGAAWLLLERQADADVELVRAVDDLDDSAADWIIADGDEPTRGSASRSRAPRVALANAWGDLGPASGLSAAVAAVLALRHGFVPAPNPVEQDCDRVACTSVHGRTSVTLTIGARAS